MGNGLARRRTFWALLTVTLLMLAFYAFLRTSDSQKFIMRRLFSDLEYKSNQLDDQDLQFLRKFKTLVFLNADHQLYTFGTYDAVIPEVKPEKIVMYQIQNSLSGDYKTFRNEEDLRAVYGLATEKKRFLGLQVDVPKNSNFARKWRNSKFLDCLSLRFQNQQGQRSLISASFVDKMAKFRDFIDGYKSLCFLFGGTLLGWYRECAFIQDTTDVDFAMKIDDLDQSMLEDLNDLKEFKLFWILGKPNDSLEVSVYSDSTKIDLFFIYPQDNNTDWAGGMIVEEKRKLRWIYPKIKKLCTGDLYGKLFHVPCNVEQVLKADYGPAWRYPHRNSEFVWHSSHKNVRNTGFWTDDEWNSVYNPSF